MQTLLPKSIWLCVLPSSELLIRCTRASIRQHSDSRFDSQGSERSSLANTVVRAQRHNWSTSLDCSESLRSYRLHEMPLECSFRCFSMLKRTAMVAFYAVFFYVFFYVVVFFYVFFYLAVFFYFCRTKRRRLPITRPPAS